MHRDLQRYFRLYPVVDMIYQDRSGRFTKRRVRLLSITKDRVQAYCYARGAHRVFRVENILAVSRPPNKQNAV